MKSRTLGEIPTAVFNTDLELSERGLCLLKELKSKIQPTPYEDVDLWILVKDKKTEIDYKMDLTHFLIRWLAELENNR